MGKHYRSCFRGIVRGNGHNVDIILGGDIKVWCIAWRIGYMPKKCFGLKKNATTQQEALQEAFATAIEAEKEHLNFMEDIECYHQMLIDMNKSYWRGIETFVKVTK